MFRRFQSSNRRCLIKVRLYRHLVNHVHAHTHTHTHTHTCTHTHVHTHMYIHKHVHTHTCTCTCTHTHTHTHMYTGIEQRDDLELRPSSGASLTKNYASIECGAKVIETNPGARVGLSIYNDFSIYLSHTHTHTHTISKDFSISILSHTHTHTISKDFSISILSHTQTHTISIFHFITHTLTLTHTHRIPLPF